MVCSASPRLRWRFFISTFFSTASADVQHPALPQSGLSCCRSLFLLSGLVMAYVHGAGLASSWQANWWKFASARFARIYPLFALTTLATMMIVALSDIQPLYIWFSVRPGAPAFPAAAVGLRLRLERPNLVHQHRNRSVYHFPLCGWLPRHRKTCGIRSRVRRCYRGGTECCRRRKLKLFYWPLCTPADAR